MKLARGILIVAGVAIIIPGFVLIVYHGADVIGIVLLAVGVIVGMVGRPLAFKK